MINRYRGRRRHVGRHRYDMPIGVPAVDPWGDAPLFPAWSEYWRSA